MIYLSVLFMLLFGIAPSNELVSDDTLAIQKLQHDLNTANPIRKVRTLNNLSKYYQHIDPKKAIAYSERSAALARKVNYKKGLANAYNNSGNAYMILGNYPKATQLYYLSLKIREDIKDSIEIAGSYNNLAMVFNAEDNFNKALTYYEKSLSIQRKIKDNKYLNITLGNIGSIYHVLKQYNKALRYYKESLALEARADKAFTFNNIGLLYLDHNKQVKKALPYFKQALEISEETGNKFDKLNALGGIASVQLQLKQYPLALKAAKEQLELATEMASEPEKLQSLELLKDIHTARGDHERV